MADGRGGSGMGRRFVAAPICSVVEGNALHRRELLPGRLQHLDGPPALSLTRASEVGVAARMHKRHRMRRDFLSFASCALLRLSRACSWINPVTRKPQKSTRSKREEVS